jgi:hypothetical protein
MIKILTKHTITKEILQDQCRPLPIELNQIYPNIEQYQYQFLELEKPTKTNMTLFFF